MATRTVFCPLPNLTVIDGNTIEEQFQFTQQLSLCKTPGNIRDLTAFNPVGLTILGEHYYESIRHSEWSLACDYEDPAYPVSNVNNIVVQRDHNIAEAKKVLWRLAILTGLKFQTNLFPSYTILANQNGTDAFLEQSLRTADGFKNRLFLEELATLKFLFPIFDQYYQLADSSENKISTAIIILGEALLQRMLLLKLVLLMTSFECLFNSNGKNITHKLAHRTASFLGKGKNGYLKIYSEVEVAYKTRCNFVHSGIIHITPTAKSHYDIACQHFCAVITNLIEDVNLKPVWGNDPNSYRKWLASLDNRHFKRT